MAGGGERDACSSHFVLVGDGGARFLHVFMRFQFSDTGVIRHGSQEDETPDDGWQNQA
jgi:hypothetical protein